MCCGLVSLESSKTADKCGLQGCVCGGRVHHKPEPVQTIELHCFLYLTYSTDLDPDWLWYGLLQFTLISCKIFSKVLFRTLMGLG